MPSPSDFIGASIRPERSSSTETYTLTKHSVTLTQQVRDAAGKLREESICILPHRKFVDPAGNVVDVPVRTGRVPSSEPEATRYENVTVNEQIIEGSIPLESCPYSTEAKHLIYGPYVLVPKGADDCGGKPDGCEHLWSIIKMRRATTRAKWEAELPERKTMTPDEAAAIVRAMRDADAEYDTEPAPTRKPKGAPKPPEVA